VGEAVVEEVFEQRHVGGHVAIEERLLDDLAGVEEAELIAYDMHGVDIFRQSLGLSDLVPKFKGGL